MQAGIGGHDKRNYRVDRDGKVAYAESKVPVDTEAASLQQRTGIGKHKDGSVYLRACDSEDLSTIRAASDSMGISYRQRRSGASHFGRRGSFEHLHFDRPTDALKVHAALNFHLHDEEGQPKGAEEHLERLERGLAHHTLGKDGAADKAVSASRAAMSRSKTAVSTDLPEAHAHAAEMHRAAREMNQAQAVRPWPGNESVLHAGMAILHHRLIDHHEKAGSRAQKRIEAEQRRREELRQRMEEIKEGREAKKGLETAGAGTDVASLEGGGALRAEGRDNELADATMPREVEKAIELDPLPEPTEAQLKAGNYQKHHVKVNGLDISIENPVGSTRSGVAKDGTAWETTMKHHYGYLKRTEGADGDHVDCFVGPEPENPYVHVINQIEPTTGAFDEHKCMIGFPSREAAKEAYHANYQDGWKGFDTMRTMHVDDFKDWLKNGDTTGRLVYKACGNRLHGAACAFYKASRLRPALKSFAFQNAVHAAKDAGLSRHDILALISNAVGGDQKTANRMLASSNLQ